MTTGGSDRGWGFLLGIVLGRSEVTILRLSYGWQRKSEVGKLKSEVGGLMDFRQVDFRQDLTAESAEFTQRAQRSGFPALDFRQGLTAESAEFYAKGAKNWISDEFTTEDTEETRRKQRSGFPA
ncbi:hypothetical protein SAMN05661099_1224 [Daejeonella lutea]|uniref:Uncharacterized protein n=1 Tax=Daejeonella lutea TaxID=572036 RepID=A0A1T5B3H3_9SPHI|nr:hypothetical protein SAMN05661099_1224 [Daejeonella lutea]